MIRLTFVFVICLLYASCYNKKITSSSKSTGNLVFIEVANLPTDTATIQFYKINNLWHRKIKYWRYGKKNDSVECRSCKNIFTDEFINTLRLLKTEVYSMDCRKTTESAVNGEIVGSIEDFYTMNHMLYETISIRTGKDTLKIQYASPREALSYCKHNEDRLKFIYMIDSLRSIK